MRKREILADETPEDRVIEVGMTVTSPVLYNADDARKCSKRVIVLADSPYKSNTPCTIPAALADRYDGKLLGRRRLRRGE